MCVYCVPSVSCLEAVWNRKGCKVAPFENTRAVLILNPCFVHLFATDLVLDRHGLARHGPRHGSSPA